jgi:hypothetical protein
MADMADAISFVRGDTYRELWPVTTLRVQDVVIEGSPSSGSLKLVSRDATTAPIPTDASASAVQTALLNLSTVDAGDLTVAGGPGPDTKWTVTIAAPIAFPLALAEVTLSGGAAPTATVRPTAFDLTGCTLRWTLKTSAAVADNLATLTHVWAAGNAAPPGSWTVADPTTGRATHKIAATESAGLVAGTVYVWDLQLTDAVGDATTIGSGTLTVTADVGQTVP